MNFNEYKNDLLSSKKNIMFSKLRGNDLEELLNLVNNYNLSFREELLFNEKYKFGCEIEYEKIFRHFVTRFIRKNFWRWESKVDTTCSSGGEITTPIFHNRKEDWQELKQVCEFLKSKNADMLHSASCHVHTDRHLIEDIKDNRLFLKTWACYEHIMFRFGYGDKLNARKKIREYASPVADLIFEVLDKINEYDVKYMSFPQTNKYYAINYLTGAKNTLECRIFNATTSCEVVQNYINATISFLSAPQKGLIDPDFIEYKLKNEFVSPIRQWYKYNEIVLQNALELVDLIFDNCLDKIYFLVQYFKRFQSNYGANEVVYAKKFVR